MADGTGLRWQPATVETLRAAVTRAALDRSERVAALKRLVKFGEERVRKRLGRSTGE